MDSAKLGGHAPKGSRRPPLRPPQSIRPILLLPLQHAVQPSARAFRRRDPSLPRHGRSRHELAPALGWKARLPSPRCPPLAGRGRGRLPGRTGHDRALHHRQAQARAAAGTPGPARPQARLRMASGLALGPPGPRHPRGGPGRGDARRLRGPRHRRGKKDGFRQYPAQRLPRPGRRLRPAPARGPRAGPRGHPLGTAAAAHRGLRRPALAQALRCRPRRLPDGAPDQGRAAAVLRAHQRLARGRPGDGLPMAARPGWRPDAALDRRPSPRSSSRGTPSRWNGPGYASPWGP